MIREDQGGRDCILVKVLKNQENNTISFSSIGLSKRIRTNLPVPSKIPSVKFVTGPLYSGIMFLYSVKKDDFGGYVFVYVLSKIKLFLHTYNILHILNQAVD